MNKSSKLILCLLISLVVFFITSTLAIRRPGQVRRGHIGPIRVDRTPSGSSASAESHTPTETRTTTSPRPSSRTTIPNVTTVPRITTTNPARRVNTMLIPQTAHNINTTYDDHTSIYYTTWTDALTGELQIDCYIDDWRGRKQLTECWKRYRNRIH